MKSLKDNFLRKKLILLFLIKHDTLCFKSLENTDKQNKEETPNSPSTQRYLFIFIILTFSPFYLYSHAPYNNMWVKDRPNAQWWFLKIIMEPKASYPSGHCRPQKVTVHCITGDQPSL